MSKLNTELLSLAKCVSDRLDEPSECESINFDDHFKSPSPKKRKTKTKVVTFDTKLKPHFPRTDQSNLVVRGLNMTNDNSSTSSEIRDSTLKTTITSPGENDRPQVDDGSNSTSPPSSPLTSQNLSASPTESQKLDTENVITSSLAIPPLPVSVSQVKSPVENAGQQEISPTTSKSKAGNLKESDVNSDSFLSTDDITEEDELWIIMAPKDYKLKKQHVEITGRQELKDGKFEMQFFPNETPSNNITTILSENGKLINGRKFRGCVQISEKLQTFTPVYHECVEKKNPIPTGLKRRYVPFGADIHNEKTQKVDKHTVGSPKQTAESSPEKRKTHKRKNLTVEDDDTVDAGKVIPQNSELNVNNTRTIVNSSPSKSKRHKKNRTSVSIINESENIDSLIKSEITTGQSQKQSLVVINTPVNLNTDKQEPEDMDVDLKQITMSDASPSNLDFQNETILTSNTVDGDTHKKKKKKKKHSHKNDRDTLDESRMGEDSHQENQSAHTLTDLQEPEEVSPSNLEIKNETITSDTVSENTHRKKKKKKRHSETANNLDEFEMGEDCKTTIDTTLHLQNQTDAHKDAVTVNDKLSDSDPPKMDVKQQLSLLEDSQLKTDTSIVQNDSMETGDPSGNTATPKKKKKKKKCSHKLDFETSIGDNTVDSVTESAIAGESVKDSPKMLIDPKNTVGLIPEINNNDTSLTGGTPKKKKKKKSSHNLDD